MKALYVLCFILGIGCLGVVLVDLFADFLATWLFYVLQIIGWVLLAIGKQAAD